MSAFEEIVTFTMMMEGGYVNNPKDPGGPTNYGITQKTYSNWLALQGLDDIDVRDLDTTEAIAIYREQYWRLIRGDNWPREIACYLFDFAVHSGVSKAVKTLQRILDVTQDGYVGTETLRAGLIASNLLFNLHHARLAFIRKLYAYKHFGPGWENRLKAAYEFARSGIGKKRSIIIDKPKKACGVLRGETMSKFAQPALGTIAGLGVAETILDIGEKSTIPWFKCVIGTVVIFFIICFLYKHFFAAKD